ncbi:hypothetical protein ACG3OX_20025, partial [Pseudomonas aeruginosa]
KLFFKAYPTKSLSLPLYPTIFSLYPSGLSHSLSESRERRTGAELTRMLTDLVAAELGAEGRLVGHGTPGLLLL